MLVGRTRPVSVKQLLRRMLVILVREKERAFALLGWSAEAKTETQKDAAEVSIPSLICQGNDKC